MRLLFDIAEQIGEPDPFVLRKKISRKAFIWWGVRKELKISNFHEKWEYYAAAIRNDIKSIFDGEPRAIGDGLIKLTADKDKAEKEQEMLDMALFEAL